MQSFIPLRPAALLFMLPLLLMWWGCEKDPASPEEDNEQELITKVVLTLTESGSGSTVTATYNDPDGPGGMAPTIGSLTVKAGSTYAGTIEVFDETKTPAVNLTDEIKEEADAHQFFYTPQGELAGRLVVTITDKDSKNLPLGLVFHVTVTAGPPVTGSATNSLNVVLSHYDKDTKNGRDRSDESDIDINVPVGIVN
ncbi:MAG: hypothetical protein ONB48_14235 [candidate division KSB1 bacterium]|nr:hypothetical protein [candidate division KSB1 bacterium]MDZ7273604.1 hypothetical protein [candidate division KSB1 bacterium]MDZ7286805.1 hypothetical protein [candidate division KSB1 bacterium]MDZ7299838.1 hypothetical protein [candidate division KSB1 bacterium]MDZ7307751.1 hypothetical protein [candidate division KSB1 bacterium]